MSASQASLPLASMPFVRNLASSDRRLRVHAVSLLKSHLVTLANGSPDRAIDYHNALKIWNGLFFALWMTDGPRAQQSLCADVATLVALFNSPAHAAIWLRAFWAVMSRRWADIDAHRMDKFMLLVRRVLGASLHRCITRSHDDSGGGSGGDIGGDKDMEIIALVAVLSHEGEGPLESGGDLAQVPVGIRLHVLDILVDECERAGMLARDNDDDSYNKKNEYVVGIATKVAMHIEDLVQKVVDNVFHNAIKARARMSLEDERLWWKHVKWNDDDHEDSDESWEGLGD